MSAPGGPVKLEPVKMPKMSEKDWRDVVVQYALLWGWKVYYTQQSVRVLKRTDGESYRARNVNPEGVGFPDLVLVRKHRLLFVELKRDPEKGHHHPVTPEQDEWMNALAIAGAEVHVWRPMNTMAVEATLR